MPGRAAVNDVVVLLALGVAGLALILSARAVRAANRTEIAMASQTDRIKNLTSTVNAANAAFGSRIAALEAAQAAPGVDEQALAELETAVAAIATTAGIAGPTPASPAPAPASADPPAAPAG